MMTKAQLTTLAGTLTEAQAAAAIRHVIDADPALARAALDAAIALYPVEHGTSSCQCRGPGQGCLREPRAEAPR